MTTQDKNKVIAEYMELKPCKIVGQYMLLDGYIKYNMEYSIDALKYHTSWDWLMPVVDKIEATKKYVVVIVGNNCFIQDIESYKNKMTDPKLFINEYGETKILAVHEAIYQFIINTKK